LIFFRKDYFYKDLQSQLFKTKSNKDEKEKFLNTQSLIDLVSAKTFEILFTFCNVSKV
jgi:hypothetical protein